MYEFVSLNVKCPACGTSLMDNEKLVDNKASIRLDLEMKGQKGTVYLSSIYGSYNFSCDVDLEAGVISKFFCPHCHVQVTSDAECLTCGAPMVPFYLDMGGKVSVCSRSGCKNHFVEFEDLSVALRKLYEEYGFEDTLSSRPSKPAGNGKVHEPVKDEKSEIIETGTFLYSYCPHCKKSLIEHDLLKLKITKGETGYLLLSPYLNVFSSKSTIVLPEDQRVEEISCFHCDHSLIETEKKCGKCGSPVAKIAVSAQTKLIDFYICTMKGCRWHGLKEDDMYDIRLEDSLEW